MSELTGQTGELRFTIQITRKETGKVEEYELIGKIDGGNTLNSSEGRGDERGDSADRNVG